MTFPRLIPLGLLRRRDFLTRTIRLRPRHSRLRILSLDHKTFSKSVISLHLMTLPQHLKRLLRVRGPLVFVARNSPVVPVVVFKRVRFFAVDGVVADFAHLVRHA